MCLLWLFNQSITLCNSCIIVRVHTLSVKHTVYSKLGSIMDQLTGLLSSEVKFGKMDYSNGLSIYACIALCQCMMKGSSTVKVRSNSTPVRVICHANYSSNNIMRFIINWICMSGSAYRLLSIHLQHFEIQVCVIDWRHWSIVIRWKHLWLLDLKLNGRHYIFM